MNVFLGILKNFPAFLMAILLTVFPVKIDKPCSVEPAEDNCVINLSLISDIHLEKNGFFRQSFLKASLSNLSHTAEPIDAILVAGDLTNYADEPALKEYYDLMRKYSPAPVISAAGNHDIGHAGDRDVTDISREEALQNFIRYQSEYAGEALTHGYYSTYVKQYKVIVLCDEVIDGGHWDDISMTDEQLRFLDSELAEGTKNGLPVFVLCHWPLDGINGEDTIWDGSGIDLKQYDIKSILEKYKNVFYISGHMHSGIKAVTVDKKYGLSNAEQVNGVTYINLPTFGIVNMYGLPWSGTGAQLEVYTDKVIFRPRNFVTNVWYSNAEYRFQLVK